MRKNEKKVITTRTSIIAGRILVGNYHGMMIRTLEKRLIKARAKGENVAEILENLRYHRGWRAYFEEEIRRLSLTRLVCGDPTTLIRG